MGTIPVGTAHDKRSSGMSLANRRYKFNTLFFIPILFAVLSILFMVLLYGVSDKGAAVSAESGQDSTVGNLSPADIELAQDSTVLIGDHSEWTLFLKPQLHPKPLLSASLFHPVEVIADGQMHKLFTTEETVADVLRHYHIPIGTDDKVEPFLYSSLPDHPVEISIVRVSKVEEVIEETLHFQTVEQPDPNLLKGERKTLQKGQEGILLKKFENIFENGQQVAQNLIEETVQAKSIDNIVAIGTAKPVVALSASTPEVETVTKDGVTFGVKKVLENVKLTAYTAGGDSTGKSADSKQYGITYSGARVKEGQTVAVDPRVIPMGWWMFIEGYGFRKAEDIGGSIKGKWVDIYYDSEKFAQQFGMKKGVKVYVIGPQKPTAN